MKSYSLGVIATLFVTAILSFSFANEYSKDYYNLFNNFKERMYNNSSTLSQVERNKQGIKTIELDKAQEIEEKLLLDAGYYPAVDGYRIVDTGTTEFYGSGGKINEPNEGEVYFGQDGNYKCNSPSYTNNGDGTVTDQITGLMWQSNPGEKMTWEEAVENLDSFDLGGYHDWRLPTIKELYSLIKFNGVTGRTAEESKPYIDIDYFEFSYGDLTGERFIDSQFATSTIYDSTTMGGNTTMFGVNFADGRIKGYPTSKDFYVLYVRGNENYGQNMFVENNDGTITDLATGLMWMTYDSGYFSAGDINDGTMNWEDALEWCENLEYAGYDDWKLPDVKELQSIVDYSKSVDTTNSAAINPIFNCTSIINIIGNIDYANYWTSTTHLDGRVLGSQGVYLSFGRALGEMNGVIMDVHGAGAQRSDPKTGERGEYPSSGNGPQGDVRTVFNMVRAVRCVN